MNIYYVYAYLRKDGTPYYIGKGKDNRAYRKHRNITTPNRSRIVLLEENMSEHQALLLEMHLIDKYGRKDLGTGILRNLTNGGEGSSGRIVDDEERNERRMKANEVYSSMSDEERRAKFGKSGSDNPFWGKSHTEYSIKKMRRSHQKQRAKLINCFVCEKKVDAQNYALHHGEKCGSGSAIRGRSWYHLNDMSYYLYSDDKRITELNLVKGRSSKHKRSNQYIKLLNFPSPPF